MVLKRCYLDKTRIRRISNDCLEASGLITCCMGTIIVLIIVGIHSKYIISGRTPECQDLISGYLRGGLAT